MRKSNFALRLQPSLLEEARKLAEEEGVAVNQLINVAVAEKLSALRTEAYFRERGDRADPKKYKAILARVGKGKPPMEGDELPPAKRRSKK
jgi:hypothetical protein